MAIAIGVVGLAGCQPKGQKSATGIGAATGGASVIITTPSSQSTHATSVSSSSSITAGGGFSALAATGITVPGPRFFQPVSLDDFDCFAINVIGPGINTSSGCGGDATLGLTAGFISRNAALSLNVPFGQARTFQLWGFAHSDSCPDVVSMLHTPKGGFPPGANSAGFLLAQTTMDIFARDITVNMSPSFKFGVNSEVCGGVVAPST
ncbi:MAG: hypothetical protein HY074_18750, partial [Deltaproteobacteria bacterium]|nr:hypothetical protein [Deltaproteobacteria bacterium]